MHEQCCKGLRRQRGHHVSPCSSSFARSSRVKSRTLVVMSCIVWHARRTVSMYIACSSSICVRDRRSI